MAIWGSFTRKLELHTPREPFPAGHWGKGSNRGEDGHIPNESRWLGESSCQSGLGTMDWLEYTGWFQGRKIVGIRNIIDKGAISLDSWFWFSGSFGFSPVCISSIIPWYLAIQTPHPMDGWTTAGNTNKASLMQDWILLLYGMETLVNSFNCSPTESTDGLLSWGWKARNKEK